MRSAVGWKPAGAARPCDGASAIGSIARHGALSKSPSTRIFPATRGTRRTGSETLESKLATSRPRSTGSDAPTLAPPDPATETRFREVAAAFEIPGRWLGSRSYGSGWINETLLAEFDDGNRRTRWIQQRLNTR